MLLNTQIGIAFKNIYGQYDIKEFNVFELEKINSSFTSIKVDLNKRKTVVLKVRCPLCGEMHYYYYKANEFIKRDMVIGGCELVGDPIFYIGKKSKVIETMNRYKETSKKIYALV